MKFLCDVHIAYRLVNFLRRAGHDATHVNRLPDKWFTTDNFIANYADENDYVVISKDVDFKNSHFLSGSPRRFIRIHLGNISNDRLVTVFEQHLFEIEQYLATSHNCFIEISEDIIRFTTA